MNVIKNRASHTSSSMITFLKTAFYSYRTTILSAIIAGLVAGGGALFYRWYDVQVQQTAYTALKKAIQVYERPIAQGKNNQNGTAFASAQEKWAAVDSTFKEAYEQHASSGIAAFFLAYRGDAALEAGELENAYKFYQEDVEKLPHGELRDLWLVKSSLIGIDTGDTQKCARGLETLQKLAAQTTSSAAQYAHYELGLYYWHAKDFSRAKNIWQDFIVKYASNDSSQDDFFVNKVKSKLALITVEN